MFPMKHWKQFWKPRRKRFGTSWIYFALYTNMFQKIYLFQKEFLLLKTLLWTRRIQFWQPQRYVFGRSPKSFQSISENVTNTFSFLFRKVFFFEMFLCKHRKQFWQPRRNCFGTNWILFARCSKRFRKVYNRQREIFFFKILVWTRRIKFWKTHWNISGRSSKSFQTVSKNVKNTFRLFSEKNFSSKCSYGHIENSFGSSAEIVSEQTEFFLLDVQKGFEKFTRFKRRLFSSKNCDGP